MQTVFKGIYKTIERYQNEVSSSPLQFAGALALAGSPTCFRLPVGSISAEGVCTVIETVDGISWNGVMLSPGDSLSGKLSIDPPSGYAIRFDPYLDETGKKVKVAIRKADEPGAVHNITFDTSIVNAGQANESATIHVYDQSGDLQAKTLYYSASILGPADFADRVVTGSFGMTNGVGNFSKQIRADLNTEGDELLQFKISTDSAFSKVVGTTPVITVKDVSKGPTVTVTSTAVSEGEAVTFTVSFAASTIFDATYYYAIDSVSGLVNGNDFSDGTMNGSFSINSTTKIGTFTKTLRRDLLTEGPESFAVYIKQGSISGDTISSTTISVVDSSFGAGSITAALACSSSPATEGQSLTFTLSDPDRNFNGSMYYLITGTGGFSKSDLLDNQVSGLVTGSDTSISFSKTLRNDYAVESSETLTVTVGSSLTQYFSIGIYDNPGDGWDGGGTATILVNGIAVTPQFNNTSWGSTTISMTETNTTGPKFFNVPVKIGDLISLNVTPGSYTETTIMIYSGRDGTGTSLYNSGLLTGGAGVSYTGLANVTASAQYFTSAHAVTSDGLPVGVTLPSVTVNIIDNSQAFVGMTCSIVSPQASYNEGSTITFQVTDPSSYTGSVYYAVIQSSGNVSSSDFSSGYAALASEGSFAMTNGSGTFSLVLANDLSVSEGQESFYVRLRKIGGALRVRTVPNTNSTNASSATGNVVVDIYDGGTSAGNFVANATFTGYYLTSNYWSLTSNMAYFRITSATNKYAVLEVLSPDDTLLASIPVSGFSSTYFGVEIPSNRYSYITVSPTVTVNDTSAVNPATVSVTPTNYNEGQNVSVAVSNLANGTYYYTIEGTNITSTDFSSAFSGSFTVSGGVGTFTLSLTLANDLMTEGAESFIVRIRAGSTSGTIIGSSAAISINDTSVAATLVERIPVNITTSNVTTGMPLHSAYNSQASQFIFTATELANAGLSAGSVIKGIKFYLSANMMTAYNWTNFVIGMQHTTLGTTTTTSVVSGYQEVYRRNSAFIPSTATYTSLTTPIFNFVNATGISGSYFTWDGTSNIVFKVAFGINGYFSTTSGSSMAYTNITSAGTTRYSRSDTVAHTLATTTSSTSTNRPKIGLLV